MAQYQIPTEDEEQAALFEWAESSKAKHPDLQWMYAIPNGGKRPIKTARTMKKTGTKKGVPDIFLPAPRGKYHGMYIEMKRTSRGQLSSEQREWLRALSDRGYYCVMCKGWVQAAKEIVIYLTQRNDSNG